MPTATVLEEQCEECSQSVTADRLVTLVEGDRWCGDCARFCEGCAAPTRHTSHTVDDTYLCARCLLGWHRCERCDLFTEDLVSVVSGPQVCSSCSQHYDLCSDCGDRTDFTYTVDGGDEVCSDCRNDSYHYCSDCELLVPTCDSRCEECARGSDDYRVHDYYYRPNPVFYGDGPLFLGLELELITPTSTFTDAVDLAVEHLGGLGYLKEDGSIRPNGFEMVTHPMSWDYARADFPWRLLNKLRLLGCRTNASVGIHVHVSRTGFTSPAHIYRWLKFVYRNESQVCTLARRRGSEWAEFSPQAREAAVEFAKGSTAGFGRYQAINVYPEHTFELRIFASSLAPRQVKAALGFAAASVEYTRTLTAADIARRRGWEWSAFCTWLTTRPEYSDLLTELQELACAC
ncbi:hypothetical protein [Nocardia aurea]|uniref:hypothetical protein n=1 Tax=Nocardia aurea TaxID=2144174 RepID=UPI001E44A205|nr:hypothetical protein [Nocardia aurea]